jgi:hypothetical protein
MLRIFKALYQSRKAWVGGITVLATAMFSIWIAPALGLDADQAAQIAVAIVAAGVAIIAGIAVEDHGVKAAGKTPKAPLLLLLALGLAVAVGGCMAPADVREAQAWERAAWTGYMANNARILAQWEQNYDLARQSDINYTTEKAIAILKKATTPEEIEAGVRAVIENRDKALADTDRIKKRMRELAAVNQLEAAKALRIHGGVDEWMAAGMDESAIPGMISEIETIIQSAKPAP